MRITKDEIPATIDAPGAVARQLGDFGAAPKGALAAEYLSLGAGVDIAPLLQGLEGNACQAPHWGYVIEGHVVVSYADGTQDECRTNDLVYWPSGHSVRVVDDTELVLFSPHLEHAAVMDHMRVQMGL